MEDKIDAALTCDKGCGHTVDYETCYAHQVQKVKNLLLEAQITALKKLDDDFMPKDTNCAEFYLGAQDSCEPIEHARRSGRFEVDMELHEFIDTAVSELQEMLNHE